MSYFRRTVLICNLVLVAMLTSVFGIASANSFIYTSYNDGTEAMLKMEAPALDCQQHDEPEIENNIVWDTILAFSAKETKTSHHCCPAMNVTTLFPATAVVELANVQPSSLVLIQHEQMGKTHTFIETIYRPPIS